MCLIVVAWRLDPAFPLVVVANRDEFHARPTAPAAAWPDAPDILGGRDLQAGGTWLAAARDGRWAALTNIREPGQPAAARSRGELPSAFLRGRQAARDYAAGLDLPAYGGFNLLLGDGDELLYLSNRGDAPRSLPPGLYGLSNHRLDTPWPKLCAARAALADALPYLPDHAPCFELLADTAIVPDEALPQTGVPLDWERRLSAIFVRSPEYGTRASTVLRQDANGNRLLEERSFDSAGTVTEVRLINF